MGIVHWDACLAKACPTRYRVMLITDLGLNHVAWYLKGTHLMLCMMQYKIIAKEFSLIYLVYDDIHLVYELCEK